MESDDRESTARYSTFCRATAVHPSHHDCSSLDALSASKTCAKCTRISASFIMDASMRLVHRMRRHPYQALGLDPLRAAWPMSNAPKRPAAYGRGSILGPAASPPWRAVRSTRGASHARLPPPRAPNRHRAGRGFPLAGESAPCLRVPARQPGPRRISTGARPRLPGRILRVNSADQPICLYAVPRTLELSLQSSFHFSLTVLVRYRTHASI
ncbi:hypothetical protein DPMN_005294 [Dreissena polymorpha]|uniref:Uncharacterized protein n=1 Tax=Dreissena polymorpha TaxID=45954 RepID=A0A9D4RUA3_DREPO|nr:hypothetical protein DPMN_005294 [Dreissena polymorpha]